MPVVGFTTRVGGVSPSPYDDLSYSRSVGDDPATSRRTRTPSVAPRCRRAPARQVNQVHGVSVLRRSRTTTAGGGNHDAIIDRPGRDHRSQERRLRAVLLLDCQKRGRSASTTQGGGTALKAPAAPSRRWRRRTEGPRGPVAVIGTAIGPCCYAVGPRRRRSVRKAFGTGKFIRQPGRPRANLHEANRHTSRGGLDPERVHVVRLCRLPPRALLYSHRRVGGRAEPAHQASSGRRSADGPPRHVRDRRQALSWTASPSPLGCGMRLGCPDNRQTLRMALSFGAAQASCR